MKDSIKSILITVAGILFLGIVVAVPDIVARFVPELLEHSDAVSDALVLDLMGAGIASALLVALVLLHCLLEREDRV